MTTMKKFSLLAAVGVLAFAQTGYAFTSNFTGGGSPPTNWNDVNNWDNGVPAAGDVAVFSKNTTVAFTSGIPTNLAEIRVTHASAAITMQPGSAVTLTVPIITVSAGSLTFDALQQTSVATSITVSSGANLFVKARMDLAGAAVSITGAYDASADVRSLSGSPAITINSGGVMKLRDGAGLTYNSPGAPTPTLTINSTGELQAINGTLDIDTNYAIVDSSTAVYRVIGTVSTPGQMSFHRAGYTGASALNGDFRLNDQNSQFSFQNNLKTNGGFDSPYSTPCDGKVTGSSTFTWTTNIGVPPGSC